MAGDQWPATGGRLLEDYGMVSGQWPVTRRPFGRKSFSGARMVLLMDHPQALAVNMGVDLCGT